MLMSPVLVPPRASPGSSARSYCENPPEYIKFLDSPDDQYVDNKCTEVPFIAEFAEQQPNGVSVVTYQRTVSGGREGREGWGRWRTRAPQGGFDVFVGAEISPQTVGVSVHDSSGRYIADPRCRRSTRLRTSLLNLHPSAARAYMPTTSVGVSRVAQDALWLGATIL